jgi:hypothetical protein
MDLFYHGAFSSANKFVLLTVGGSRFQVLVQAILTKEFYIFPDTFQASVGDYFNIQKSRSPLLSLQSCFVHILATPKSTIGVVSGF